MVFWYTNPVSLPFHISSGQCAGFPICYIMMRTNGNFLLGNIFRLKNQKSGSWSSNTADYITGGCGLNKYVVSHLKISINESISQCSFKSTWLSWTIIIIIFLLSVSATALLWRSPSPKKIMELKSQYQSMKKLDFAVD